MNPFIIKFFLGFLVMVWGLSATAQSPHVPAAPSQAQQKSERVRSVNPPAPDISQIAHVDYLAVRLKGADSNRSRPLASRMRDKIISTSGFALKFKLTDGGEVHIFTLPRLMLEAEAEEIATRIRLLPEVEWVNYDQGAIVPFAVPTDPLNSPSVQSPQAPYMPSQEQQKSGEIGTPVPFSQPLDLRNFANIENLSVALKSRNELDPKPLSKKLQKQISEAAGVPLQYVRVGGGEWHVFKLPKLMTRAEAEEIAARIRMLPEIEYADPSGGGDYFAAPTDPSYLNSQWNLQSGAGGANLPSAWDLTTGKNTLVVAEPVVKVDTGAKP